jgi:putative ATP-dependent endonuclease of OLD family
MYLESISLRNFRCYGDIPVKLTLEPGTNAFVGTNGAGKTAALEAFKRLFSPVASDRQLRRSDIHFGPGEDALGLEERELVIDAVFAFSDADGGATVFNDLFFSATDKALKVRLILEGRYQRSESIEDNIEVKLYSVNTTDDVPFGPDDERKSPLGGRATQYAQLIYIPADLSPKFPPVLRRVLGLIFWPYAACFSSASWLANSLGVRLPSEECGRCVL